MSAVLCIVACDDAKGGPSPDASRMLATDAEPSNATTTMDGSVPMEASVPIDARLPLDAGDGVLPDAGASPPLLSETGLYAPAGQVLAAGVRAFVVRYPLWSDGAAKRRWFYLPPDSSIDTTDMDEWVFPIGTKLWKEFTAIDPVTAAQTRVETRLLEKRSDGWYAMAFAWNQAQTVATAVPDGSSDVLGTAHDIPGADDCAACHMGGRDMLLGFSAIQLSHDVVGLNSVDREALGVTLGDLRQELLLSQDPVTDVFVLPGDPAAQAALGMLHANCGVCHRRGTFAFERADLLLHLLTGSLATVVDTDVYRSTVGVPTEANLGWALRIDPADPMQSSIYGRMLSREKLVAMPPLATELQDAGGAQILLTWIEALQ